MASDPLAIKGIILSSEEYKDKDRMLTILTSNMGIIKACAKGTGKQNSKNAFLSVPFMLVDFTLSDSYGFWYVKEALIIESNAGIMNSLEALAIANHISDILVKTVLQTDISKDAYELAVYSFYALNLYPNNYKSIYAAFNFKLLYYSGLATTFDYCSNCNQPVDSFRQLNINLSNSECFCNECAKVVNNSIKPYKISLNAIKVANYYVSQPVSTIFTLKLSDDINDEVYRFSTVYMSIQLDEKIIDPMSSFGIPGLNFKRD